MALCIEKEKEWLISCFRFPRTVLVELCMELGPHLCGGARSQALPVPIPGVISVRTGRPIGTGLSHVGYRGWNYPNVSGMYQDLMYSAVGQADIKPHFAVIDRFPNVIRHVTIKAPSHDEVVNVKKKLCCTV